MSESNQPKLKWRRLQDRPDWWGADAGGGTDWHCYYGNRKSGMRLYLHESAAHAEMCMCGYTTRLSLQTTDVVDAMVELEGAARMLRSHWFGALGE